MSRLTPGKVIKAADKIAFWNIAVGDQVKVITGPHKGKVGKVQECLKNENKVIVSGVNVLKKTLPRFLSEKSSMDTQRLEYAGPIHYSNVQLVGDLPSAANPLGPKRRVEIKRVNRGKIFYNKEKKLLTWRRWVPGENVFLPWPRNERSRPVGPMDTKDADVATNTYLESLHNSPIPLSVQDELRNKYSKFRRAERLTKAESLEVDQVQGLEVPAKDAEALEVTDDAADAKTTKVTKRERNGEDTLGLKPETLKTLAHAILDGQRPSNSRHKSTEPNPS